MIIFILAILFYIIAVPYGQYLKEHDKKSPVPTREDLENLGLKFVDRIKDSWTDKPKSD